MSTRAIIDDVAAVPKNIVVTTGKIWEFQYARLLYTSTAGAGNRQMRLEILDAGDVTMFSAIAVPTQAASLVRSYYFFSGIPSGAAFVNGEVNVAVAPEIILLAGWKIRVSDVAAIDGADLINAKVLINERDPNRFDGNSI